MIGGINFIYMRVVAKKIDAHADIPILYLANTLSSILNSFDTILCVSHFEQEIEELADDAIKNIEDGISV